MPESKLHSLKLLYGATWNAVERALRLPVYHLDGPDFSPTAFHIESHAQKCLLCTTEIWYESSTIPT